jgi:hypothetical protein
MVSGYVNDCVLYTYECFDFVFRLFDQVIGTFSVYYVDFVVSSCGVIKSFANGESQW